MAGAGTVHHVAWASTIDDHTAWRDRVVAAGMSPTPVIDRFYFKSVYFREPSGVLFEIATLGPGFTADEPIETLGFEPTSDDTWKVRGRKRGSRYAYDIPPMDPGIPGAGTVHHVAWASPAEEHEAWQKRVAASGAHPTPIIDRFYFKSVYFREPSGVLFEIATIGPGFTVDEPLETLGERLSLPPDYEHLRERVEPLLTPLPNPRELVQR